MNGYHGIERWVKILIPLLSQLGSLQSDVHKLKSDMREVKAAAFTADEKDKVLSAADSDTALTIAKMT
jgi:hypothetical protein